MMNFGCVLTIVAIIAIVALLHFFDKIDRGLSYVPTSIVFSILLFWVGVVLIIVGCCL